MNSIVWTIYSLIHKVHDDKIPWCFDTVVLNDCIFTWHS